ncbi:MAG TPA: class I SAM-dependent methyltransferase [Catalimonadaceae bacterium]|nr:class I SAM-dependent methyltransferase [Catalimonadaceae bacterium]
MHLPTFYLMGFLPSFAEVKLIPFFPLKQNSLDKFFSFRQYLRYLLVAKGPDSIHSPFVFDFYNAVLTHPYRFYSHEILEEKRTEILNDLTVIEFEDPGAVKKFRQDKIGNLASRSLMPVEKAVLLFQLSHWLRPEKVLELGTSFGLTTAYLAKAYPSEITTFEGVSPIAERARALWESLDIFSIDSRTGKVEEMLPDFLQDPENHPDLAIVDADHRFEATIRNFQLLANVAKDGTCIVFDDIYWSVGMGKAWETIKADSRVTVSIDVFGFGIVFFRKASKKENFVLRW